MGARLLERRNGRSPDEERKADEGVNYSVIPDDIRSQTLHEQPRPPAATDCEECHCEAPEPVSWLREAGSIVEERRGLRES